MATVEDDPRALLDLHLESLRGGPLSVTDRDLLARWLIDGEYAEFAATALSASADRRAMIVVDPVEIAAGREGAVLMYLGNADLRESVAATISAHAEIVATALSSAADQMAMLVADHVAKVVGEGAFLMHPGNAVLRESVTLYTVHGHAEGRALIVLDPVDLADHDIDPRDDVVLDLTSGTPDRTGN